MEDHRLITYLAIIPPPPLRPGPDCLLLPTTLQIIARATGIRAGGPIFNLSYHIYCYPHLAWPLYENNDFWKW
jgi:hypothetical protein